MATFTPNNDPWKAGFPGQSSDQVNPVAQGLIVGETPAVVMEDMTLAASQTIAAMYTPVGLDGSGNLVPAVSGTTQAIGILMRPITSGASPIQGVEVLRQGCLNMDLIAWPASYDTDEKKLEAFRGAPTPTAIVVRRVRAGAIVAQP
ncbi:head decoration protein [Sinorhizobium meliloti]|uniref:head decoration protein n=1 Tax=Rhizobium meliloti TaxID=382 RepID=UPI0001E4A62C|nr:head decoration protein [Sinorhizobium meliloti]AEG53108.1 lambda head decoration protein D HDPD [Sinorhizobium meliloti AK83]MDE4591178.1 head decoration protein [Sinorhizobium meliloti]SEI55365.1 Bacteriophage lambda head decoration protein D [Sinorhizobium meliloti]